MVWVLCLISCNRQEWIRKLPPEHKKPVKIQGRWARNTKPKSPINSFWYKNNWSEEIYFDRPKKGYFIKLYKNTNKYGSRIVVQIITGRGKYTISGNWLLLHTTEREIIEKKDDKSCCSGFESFEHRLLYYYHREQKALLPMLYETGYTESNYGVVDGCSKPYQVDENFRTYLQIYSQKEYHSHAYFYRGEN